MKNKFIILNEYMEKTICEFFLDKYLEEHETVCDYIGNSHKIKGVIKFSFLNDKLFTITLVSKKNKNIYNLKEYFLKEKPFCTNDYFKKWREKIW